MSVHTVLDTDPVLVIARMPPALLYMPHMLSVTLVWSSTTGLSKQCILNGGNNNNLCRNLCAKVRFYKVVVQEPYLNHSSTESP